MSDELSKRAVACKGWRWMPGMAYWSGGIAYRIAYRCRESGTWVAFEIDSVGGGDRQYGMTLQHALPDLNDPATLGCLLALVREAWGDHLLHVEPYHCAEWHVWPAPGMENDRDTAIWHGETEAAALVAALEAAP